MLSEDLLEPDRRVDQIRVVCQDTTRRLSACHPTPHSADVDKRRVITIYCFFFIAGTSY